MIGFKKLISRFGIDIAGYTCLILVPLIGWLPGPGGIPLLVAGLGLLSVHNKWAKKLLDYVKKHSENLRTIIFPKKTSVEWFWDIVAIGLFIGACVVSIFVDFWLIRALATGVGALSTTIFVFNKGRIERLQRAFTKKR